MSNPIPGDDAERAAFEAWAIKYFGITKEDLIYRDGYDYPFNDAWEAFKAALAAPVSADVAADSIDTPEFESLANDWAESLESSTLYPKVMEKSWTAMIAHINAWGARRIAAGAPAETVKAVGEVKESSGENDTYVALFKPLPIGTKLYATPSASAEIARDAGALHDALTNAAKQLPPGCEIRVCIERESGWVEWSGVDGETNHIEGEGYLSDDVQEALDAAMKLQATAKEGL